MRLRPWIAMLLVALTALTGLDGAVPANAESEEEQRPTVRLVVDGQEVPASVRPQMIDGESMVPVRALAEALGYAVTWENESRTAVLAGEKLIRLPAESGRIQVDGQTEISPVAVRLTDNSLLMPLPLAERLFGLSSAWEPEPPHLSLKLTRLEQRGGLIVHEPTLHSGGTTQRVASSTCAAGTWTARYFRFGSPWDRPDHTRCEAKIQYDWGTSGPGAPGIGTDRFAVIWDGDFSFDDGLYTFSAWADDGIAVYVDGNPVINAWYDQGHTMYRGRTRLSRGTHHVQVVYYNNQVAGAVTVTWAKMAAEPANPLQVWKTLVLVYKNTDISSPVRVRASMSDKDMTNARAMVRQYVEDVYRLSGNRIVIEPTVLEIDRAVSRVDYEPNGSAAEYTLKPDGIRPELDLYGRAGNFDSIITLWKKDDGRVEVPLSRGLAWEPHGWANGAGYSSIAIPTRGGDWGGPNPDEILVHEWLHQPEKYYRAMGFDIPDLDKASSYFSDSRCGTPYAAESGTWFRYMGDLMNGRVWTNQGGRCVQTGINDNVLRTGPAACPPGYVRTTFYNSTNLGGKPVYSLCETVRTWDGGTLIGNDWQQRSPGYGLGANNFSVRWKTYAYLTEGNYLFRSWSDDGIRIKLNGNIIYDQFTGAWRTHEFNKTIWVGSGFHEIEVEYFQQTGPGLMWLTWKKTN